MATRAARIGARLPGVALPAVCLSAIAGLALALRVDHLAAKPLHYDESVNGWLSFALYWWDVYRYQPSDYHGPLLYYASSLWYELLGPGEVALRMGTVVAGALTPLLLLPARRFCNGVGLAVAGLALAVAPAFVYFSRTAIHETYLVFFSVAWAVCLARFAARPRLSWGLLAAASAAGAFAAKETAIISAGCLALGAGLAWLAGAPGAPDTDLLGGRSRREALVAAGPRAWRAWLLGGCLFGAILLALFTSFFTHARGAGDFFAAYGPWLDHAVTGRNQAKPPGYFLRVMAGSLGAWRLLSLPVAGWAMVTRDRLGLALVGWAAGALGVYSLLPYKTPWCVLEIDLPVVLLVGWGAARAHGALRNRDAAPRRRAMAGLALLATLAPAPLLARESLADNRQRFDDFRRPYVYFQTYAEFEVLLRDLLGVEEAARASRPGSNGSGPRLLVVRLAHPLLFYTVTRGWPLERTSFRSGAPAAADLAKADVVVAVDSEREAIEDLVEASGQRWHRERYFVRPGEGALAWYREDLWRRFEASGGREASPWPRPPLRELPVPEREPTLLRAFD